MSPAKGPRYGLKPKAFNVEGIVSKRVDSPYRAGRRDWIKTSRQYREVVVITGLALERGKFAGLHLSRRTPTGLQYVGLLKAELGIPRKYRAALRTLLENYLAKDRSIGRRKETRQLEARVRHRGGDGVHPLRWPIIEEFVQPMATSKPLRPGIGEHDDR